MNPSIQAVGLPSSPWERRILGAHSTRPMRLIFKDAHVVAWICFFSEAKAAVHSLGIWDSFTCRDCCARAHTQSRVHRNPLTLCLLIHILEPLILQLMQQDTLAFFGGSGGWGDAFLFSLEAVVGFTPFRAGSHAGLSPLLGFVTESVEGSGWLMKHLWKDMAATRER